MIDFRSIGSTGSKQCTPNEVKKRGADLVAVSNGSLSDLDGKAVAVLFVLRSSSVSCNDSDPLTTCWYVETVVYVHVNRTIDLVNQLSTALLS